MSVWRSQRRKKLKKVSRTIDLTFSLWDICQLESRLSHTMNSNAATEKLIGAGYNFKELSGRRWWSGKLWSRILGEQGTQVKTQIFQCGLQKSYILEIGVSEIPSQRMRPSFKPSQSLTLLQDSSFYKDKSKFSFEKDNITWSLQLALIIYTEYLAFL